MKNEKVSLLKNRNSTIKNYNFGSNKSKKNDSNKIVSFSSYKRKRKFRKKPIFANSKKEKKPYVIALYTIILLLLCLLVVFKLLNISANSQLSSKHASGNKFISENISLSGSEKDSYTYIVSSTLSKLVGITSDDNLKIDNFHKNGSFVYTHGFFSMNGKKDKIYFDLILHNKKASSLIINGKELINQENSNINNYYE